MNAASALYPLRFEPIFQYRPWGGRRLGPLLDIPLPGGEPIGEAWLLSDRDDHASLVACGPLKGSTIGELTARSPQDMLGECAGRSGRFPLLLKLLDVDQRLSVQVHPSDAYPGLIPAGETGKTEAWVVLEGGEGARVFAGLRAATTVGRLRRALAEGTVVDQLAAFTPNPGDAVLIRAGTVHSLGDVVVFEVQQNSDVTFRLYDWDHIDPRTSQRRALQVEQALACIDFEQGPVLPQAPVVVERRPVRREELIHCDQFGVTRLSGRLPFIVGKTGLPRVLVGLAGRAELEYAGQRYAFARGQVLLVPAVVGECMCWPQGAVSLLEISLPEHP